MAKIKTEHVLQVGGGILATLVILLTIQSSPVNPVFSQIAELSSSSASVGDERFAYLQTISTLKSKLNTTIDIQEKQHIQSQIDDLQLQVLKDNSTLISLQMRQHQLSFTSDLGELNKFSKIDLFRATVITMMIPFGFSIVVECIASSHNKFNKNEFATRPGIGSMVAGIVILIIGVIHIAVNHLF